MIDSCDEKLFLWATTPEQSREYVASHVKAGSIDIIIHEKSREVVAFLDMSLVKSKKNTKGMLELLAVKKDFQNKKIGTACMKYALYRFDQSNLKVAEVHALASNQTAARLYISLSLNK